jgi:hypothetical protein
MRVLLIVLILLGACVASGSSLRSGSIIETRSVFSLPHEQGQATFSLSAELDPTTLRLRALLLKTPSGEISFSGVPYSAIDQPDLSTLHLFFQGTTRLLVVLLRFGPQRPDHPDHKFYPHADTRRFFQIVIEDMQVREYCIETKDASSSVCEPPRGAA